MEKKVILSGIQATGDLTLGNYIGALKNFVKMQDEYDCYYMIANLHALTVRREPEELRNNNKKMFFIYENMASGVKEVMDDFIHLSKKATDILGCLEDMTIRDYEVHIHTSDLPKYQEVVK